LHDLLDTHQEEDAKHDCQEDSGGIANSGRRVGTGSNTFAFVATSNYKSGSNTLPIGRALGNRFLVLAHAPLLPDILVDLAVQFGLNKLKLPNSQNPGIESALNESVSAVCKPNRTFPDLVPDVISIRSLLFFSQFLALRHEAAGLIGQEALQGGRLSSAQVAAFAAHLQPVKMDLCRRVWNALRSSFQIESDFPLPTVKDLILDSFGACRTRRPLLFLYDSPLQIQDTVRIVYTTYKEVVEDLIKQSPEQKAELQKLHGKEAPLYLCPSVHSLVPGIYDRHPVKTRAEQISGNSGESLHTMLQIKRKVEKGGLIFILNPEPVIEGIHALLNDCAEDHSTVQLRGAYENVNVGPTSQIVLMVEKRACLSLHRALLSRVAVMNTGFLEWGDSSSRSCVRKHIGRHMLLYQHYAERPSVLTDLWLAREAELLDDMESPLDEFLTSLLPKDDDLITKSDPIGRLAMIGISGRLPLALQRKPIFFVEVIKHSTPASFLSAVNSVLDILETESEIERRTLLLDFTSASSVGTVEILALLGFSGLNFKSAVCSVDLGQRLWRLAARQDRRVCIVVDVSNAPGCTPGHFRAWKEKSGEPKAPRISRLISYREIREMSRSYPDWPRLSEIAKNPSLAWERSVNLVLDEVESDAIDGDDEGQLRRQELASVRGEERRELVALALKYFVPERICSRLLCPDVRVDFGDILPHAQIQNTRVDHFAELLTRVLDKGGVSFSLRMSFIEFCRQTATRVAAMMRARLHPDVILSPTPELRSFLKSILAPRTFSWQQSQQSPVQLRASCIPDEFPFLSDVLGVLRGKQHAVGPLVWNSVDSAQIQKTLKEAFPTLKDLDPCLYPKLSRSLIENLRVRVGDPRNMSTAAGLYASDLLCAVSDGSFHDMLNNFIMYEHWILVSTHMKLRLSDVAEPPADKHSFLPHICKVVLESLRHADTHLDGLYINDSDMFRRYAKRVQDAITRSEILGQTLPDVAKSRQVLKIWFLLHSQSTSKKSSNRNILLDLEVANSVMDGKKAECLFPEHLDSRHMISIFSVLDECDSLGRLPDRTIAVACTKLGLVGRGFAMLASCACRRDKSTVIQYILLYLENAFKEHGQFGTPANSQETILAAEALKELSSRNADFAEQVLEFLSTDHSIKGQAWYAMRLAAASICVPYIVDRIELIVTSGSQAQQASKNGKPNTRKAISDFFQVENYGGIAIRNFLVRCLVSRLDERGLSSCGICLRTVGHWIQPFLSKVTEGEMEGLLAIPRLDENLNGNVDDDWPNALQLALQLDCAFKDHGFRDKLKSALSGTSDLAFCRLPTAIWCSLLSSLADKGCFLATKEYRNEVNLGKYFFPGAPEGPIEWLRRVGVDIKVRSINRCSCGSLYVMENCGKPWVVGVCPSCKGPIGGTDHKYVNGNTFVGAVEQDGNLEIRDFVDRGETDVVRGIDINWFEPGNGKKERGLEPLEYRILCLLLLIPLAVFSPQRKDRCQQLRRHWEAFKQVSEMSSDTEAQHLLLGILVRSAQKTELVEALVMARCDFGNVAARMATETSFGKALRTALNGDQPHKIVAEVQARIKDHDESTRYFKCLCLMGTFVTCEVPVPSVLPNSNL
jgi:hypothetical protein